VAKTCVKKLVHVFGARKHAQIFENMHHFRKTCTILEKHASFSLGGRKERFKHLRVSLFDIRHWKLTIKNSSYSMSFVIQKSMRAFAHGAD